MSQTCGCTNRYEDCCGARLAQPITYVPQAGRPNIYSQELPPWPTIEEIRKAIRDELKKAGVI